MLALRSSISRCLTRSQPFNSRALHSCRFLLADKNSNSIFGDVTQFKESKDGLLTRFKPEDVPETGENGEAEEVDVSKLRNKDFLKDPEVQEFTNPKAKTAVEQLLSPLKRKLYEKVIAEHGQYVDNQIVAVDGKKYQLKLTKEEQQVLEPSMYLKSYRIKYSPKKAMLFTRMLRGMYLKEAITQCHFSPKKVSRDIGEMLSKGMKSAKELGLDVDDLKIYQIWVGKDGYFMKRPDYKSRGRAGMITHKYIHVRAILKPSVYRERLAAQRETRRNNRRVHEQLFSKTIRDYPKVQEYKW